MNISIRKFLLLNLLIAVTITTTLTAVGNYFLDQKDIQRHLDTFLSEFAYSIRAVVGEDIHLHTLAQLQKEFDSVKKSNQGFFLARQNLQISSYQDSKYYFQVWEKGEVVLHSANAPTVPLSTGQPGFSDRIVEHNSLRVFTTYDPTSELTFIVAEPYFTRKQLVSMIAHDEMYIILMTYPLSGFLIWLIIGRGLNSIRKVTKEVTDRDPSYLKGVDTEATPKEIKPLIIALNKLFERLQQAFDREKRFASDAAHELRTPLAAIRTQAQVALTAKDEKDRAKILQQVISGVDRSTHIVQQLLALSRLTPETSGEEEIQEFSLSKLTEEIVASLVPSALDKNIEIELDAPDPSLIIKANHTTLGILIRNLVDNAIRYTQDGGHVWVSVAKKDNSCILRVKDNGPGIPPELHSLVFERFYRVVGNKSTGSGLGLSIVKQIVHTYGGEISLEKPESGVGLEVAVTFPCA